MRGKRPERYSTLKETLNTIIRYRVFSFTYVSNGVLAIGRRAGNGSWVKWVTILDGSHRSWITVRWPM